jgi:hypothetical protein
MRSKRGSFGSTIGAMNSLATRGGPRGGADRHLRRSAASRHLSDPGLEQLKLHRGKRFPVERHRRSLPTGHSVARQTPGHRISLSQNISPPHSTPVQTLPRGHWTKGHSPGACSSPRAAVMIPGLKRGAAMSFRRGRRSSVGEPRLQRLSPTGSSAFGAGVGSVTYAADRSSRLICSAHAPSSAMSISRCSPSTLTVMPEVDGIMYLRGILVCFGSGLSTGSPPGGSIATRYVPGGNRNANRPCASISDISDVTSD